jgi:Fe-S-cluster containining protein
MGNPCRRNRCTACCVDTRMTLTEADVGRLAAAGWADFVHETRDGDLMLRNRDGRCVFLGDDGCRVYPLRPEGCRLYPLVLDLASDRVVRDEFCPHRGEFAVDPDRASRLRQSVTAEAAEAASRLRSVRG